MMVVSSSGRRAFQEVFLQSAAVLHGHRGEEPEGRVMEDGALRRDSGHGALRLRAETWLAEIYDAAVGSTAEGRREEETFQVGWRMLLQLREGHSVTMLGRVTPHDSVLEDFWRLHEKRAVPSERIMMKPL